MIGVHLAFQLFITIMFAVVFKFLRDAYHIFVALRNGNRAFCTCSWALWCHAEYINPTCSVDAHDILRDFIEWPLCMWPLCMEATAAQYV